MDGWMNTCLHVCACVYILVYMYIHKYVYVYIYMSRWPLSVLRIETGDKA